MERISKGQRLCFLHTGSKGMSAFASVTLTKVKSDRWWQTGCGV